MSLVYFKILDIEAKAVDATVGFTTDAYDFDISHDWSVSLNSAGVVGLPTYTLEVSNNKSTWYELNDLSTDVKFDDSITSDFISFDYMRLVYSANGTSAGTVDVELNMMNKTKARG